MSKARKVRKVRSYFAVSELRLHRHPRGHVLLYLEDELIGQIPRKMVEFGGLEDELARTLEWTSRLIARELLKGNE